MGCTLTSDTRQPGRSGTAKDAKYCTPAFSEPSGNRWDYGLGIVSGGLRMKVVYSAESLL